MSELKHWQSPEWSAQLLEQIAEDTLSKTRMYNADADTWRLIRPEDIGALATPPIGGLVESQYYMAVVFPPATRTVVIQYRVPTGVGITYYGVSVVTDLGAGAVYDVAVNTVKRQEIWLGMYFNGKAGDYVARGSDGVALHPVWSIPLEQTVFCRQNDMVQHRFTVKHGFTGQIEFWPLGVIAGNRKQLLVAE